jgi:hypothetical protein
MNKLMEELATRAVAEFDTEVRFSALAARGDAAAGLALLDTLNAAFKAGSSEHSRCSSCKDGQEARCRALAPGRSVVARGEVGAQATYPTTRQVRVAPA